VRIYIYEYICVYMYTCMYIYSCLQDGEKHYNNYKTKNEVSVVYLCMNICVYIYIYIYISELKDYTYATDEE